jgi:hypothetical protein
MFVLVLEGFVFFVILFRWNSFDFPGPWFGIVVVGKIIVVDSHLHRFWFFFFFFFFFPSSKLRGATVLQRTRHLTSTTKKHEGLPTSQASLIEFVHQLSSAVGVKQANDWYKVTPQIVTKHGGALLFTCIARRSG